MRKLKTVEIEGRGEVTLREVSPKGVYQAWGSEDQADRIKALIEDSVSIPWEELSEWYPSEIEALLDVFLEVNSSFLGIARKLGVSETVKEILKKLREKLPELFASSLQEDIEMRGNTDGAPS